MDFFQECWIGRSKVNKYKLMIETARASREHIKDELSKKGLKVRDNAIKDLKKTLKIKEGKYDSATMTYCKLRCQVEATAHRMKLVLITFCKHPSFFGYT
ncbi:hypothetical protein FSP39_000812 [Pinctada imbricata]|uniref:Uncharacterized protein n=1 Tax=Pinctada imbricata TaxID=66713 RepID=A0AA89C4E1_PINIB|nr:hypothetical protein FSP39_000812 [Pinctada imbricata]